MSGRFLYFAAFLIFMFSVIVSVQWYLGKRAMRWIQKREIGNGKKILLKLMVAGVIIFLNLPLFYTFTVDMPSKPLSPFIMSTVVYPYVIWGSSYVLIFLLLKFLDIFKYVSNKIRQSILKDKKSENLFFNGRRKFISVAAKTAVISPLIVSGYGVILEREDFTVREVDINIGNIPESLKHLKMAHISDIHAGIFMGKKEISRWIQVISKTEPDMLFITGDFVATSKDSVKSCIEGLKYLRSTMPIYCCLGNHDYWGNEIELNNELNRIGVKVLRNSSDVVDIGGNELNLCGVEDMRQSTPDLQKAMKGLNNEKLTILLAHNPNYFDYAKNFNINLTLSGHTHGGQINIKLPGINISPARLITKYIRGAYSEGEKHLYVTPGVGTVGFPLRINVPPEISLHRFS